MNKKYKSPNKKVLIALISEMIDAEESSDGENRAIYGRVAKMVVDKEPDADEDTCWKLDELTGIAKENGYSTYEVNW